MSTRYSEKIPGNERNWNWSVRFDSTGGYIRLVQTHEDGTIEIVLLSPGQVKALLKFLGAERKKTAQGQCTVCDPKEEKD